MAADSPPTPELSASTKSLKIQLAERINQIVNDHIQLRKDPVRLVTIKRITTPLCVVIQSGFIGLFLYCFLLATVFLVSFKHPSP